MWEGISGASGSKNLRGNLPIKVVSCSKTAASRQTNGRWQRRGGVGRTNAVFASGIAANNAKAAVGAKVGVLVVASQSEKGAGKAP